MKHNICHSEYIPMSDKTSVFMWKICNASIKKPTLFHPHAQGEEQPGMKYFSQVGHPCHNFLNC